LLHLISPADEAPPNACLLASSSVWDRFLRRRSDAGSDDALELDRDRERRLGPVCRGLGQQVQDQILKCTANLGVVPRRVYGGGIDVL
jgi:hypothetical protein